MLGFVKKIFFKEKPKKEPISDKIAEGLQKKSSEFIATISKAFEEAKQELLTMKEKYNDLLGTNYALGLKHLENGKISEAIFRFRFIKKIWPNSHDAHYYLAYCLALKDRLFEAKKILEELLQKEPGYDNRALDLLNNIKERIEKK
jgi:tetratricopeptide (TPR) repeat protein